MENKDKPFFDSNIPLILGKEIVSRTKTNIDPNIPLILDKEIVSSSEKNYEMIKIKDLINYSTSLHRVTLFIQLLEKI